MDPTKKRSTPKEKPVSEPAKPEAGLVSQEGAGALATVRADAVQVPVPPAVENLNPAMQLGPPTVHKASPVVEARLLPVEEIKTEGGASMPAPLPATIPMAATPTPAPAPVPASTPPVSAAPAAMPST